LVAVLYLVIYSAFAATTIELSGNVSGVDTSGFGYRQTDVFIIPITILGYSYTLAGYVSVGLNGSANSTNANLAGDLIVGLVRFQPGKIPLSFIGHMNGSASVNKPSASNIASFDFSVSSNVILTSYTSIVEKDSTDKVVRTVNLKDLTFSADSGTSGNNAELHYVTFNGANTLFGGTILKSGEAVSLTFLISEVLGTVTIGSVTTPVVTPKTLESIIQISGWNYVSSSNYLTLVTGVGKGSSTSSGSGSATLSSGSGDNQIYVDFADNADINGNSKSVTVGTSTTTDVSLVCDDATFSGYLTTVYNSSVSWHVVEIKFTPGASSIVYDPTVGVGKPLGNNNAGVLFFSMLFAIVLLFI